MRYLIPLLLLLSFSTTTYGKIPEEEWNCLAENIYFEARGEPKRGKIAVAMVTLNRVKSEKFPNTICEVVKQADYSKWWKETHNKMVPLRNRCQFSWWCDGIPEKINDHNAWRKARNIAYRVLQGRHKDVTFGSLYYHAERVTPTWSSTFSVATVIGNHIFYTMVD